MSSYKSDLAKLFQRSTVSCVEADHVLMTRVRKGDVSAFEVLYNRYKGPIMGFIINMIRNESVAEELMHETMLRVYEARHRYNESTRFTTWLWTIARNLCVDHFRKKKEVYLVSKDEEAVNPIEQLIEDGSDPETKLLEKSAFETIYDCLGRLPVRQRESVVLRTFSDMSYDDISATMETTNSSVKLLVHRGMKSLLECLRRKDIG